MRNVVRAVLVTALATAPAAAPAAETDAQARVENVIVTATRTATELEDLPASVTVLTRDDIQRGRTLLGLDEALNIVPGVFVQNRSNFSQDERISMRGFGARSAFGIRGVSIYVDGIPATLPDGQSQVDAIDLGATERIEVLRGPASALYGNAAGGVIRVTSTNGEEANGISLRQTFGEFDLSRTQLHGGTAWDTGDVYISANHLQTDGFRDHSAVEQRQVNGKLRWRPRVSTEFTLVGGLLDAPEAEDAGGINAAQANADPDSARDRNVALNAGEEVKQRRVGGRVAHRFGKGERQLVELGAFGLNRDFDNRLPINGGGQVSFERRFSGADLRYEVSGEWFGVPQRLTFGYDRLNQEDDRQRFDNTNGGVRGALVFDQLEEVISNALWVQHVADLNSLMTMSLGIRWDEVKLDVDDAFIADGDDSGNRSWDQISPSVGILVHAHEKVSLFASVGTAFQTPTTTELANPLNPGNGGGFNRSLEPQVAGTYELGARGRPHPKVEFEAAIFRTDINNAITSFEVPQFSGTGRDFFRNAGRSERYGTEFSAVGRPHPDVTIRGAYTFLNAEFERFVTPNGTFDGNDQPGIPPHQFNLRITWEPGEWFVQTDLMSISDFEADNRNANENEGYTLIDLRFGRRFVWPGWQFDGFAGINNVGDDNYNENVRINAFGGRFFEPGPGRHAFAGFEITRRKR